MTQALIFIPGIMGSVLKDGDEIVWPGTVGEYLGAYDRMAALLKPDLIATDVIRKVAVMDQYGSLIAALQRAHLSEADGTMVVYPYDWRKDNALAAEGLADAIEQLRADKGPEIEIILLAHSMGGLVARCYLESKRYAGRPAFGNVRALVTMGTPHLGAPVALAAATGQEKRLWLSAAQVQRLANDPAYPSLYQLLPPRGTPFVWDRQKDQRSRPLDIYSVALAQELGLSSANLQSAEDFHQLLNLSNRPAHVRYFTFAGNLKSTAHALHLVRYTTGKPVLQLRERSSGGDGTVPIWSSSLPGLQGELVDGPHGTIFHADLLKYVLGNLLGYEGTLPAAAATIVIQEAIIDVNGPIDLSIELAEPRQSVSGQIEFLRMVDGNGNTITPAAAMASAALSYQGPGIRRLEMCVQAPNYPGVYHVIFADNTGSRSRPVGLFVRAHNAAAAKRLP